MGLFDFLENKEQVEDNEGCNILLAMPMFNNGETFEFKKLVEYLKNHWNTDIKDIDGDSETIIFSIYGETIALATIQVQIPSNDIQGTAQYSYNWSTAVEDLKNHNSHVIVTVMSSNNNEVERYGILTMVLSSIIATTDCLGIYQGSQSLLIPREQYLDSAEALKSNQIPLDLWVYIGLVKGEYGNNAYTYGLSTFGKLEMEFVDTKLSLEELHSFLTNISAYVISNDIIFKSGETVGYTEEQKIKITESKGLFVEGQTFKLEI